MLFVLLCFVISSTAVGNIVEIIKTILINLWKTLRKQFLTDNIQAHYEREPGNERSIKDGNLNIDENGKNEIIETAHEDKEQDVVLQQGHVTVPGSRSSIANNIMQHDNFFLSDFSPPQTMKRRFDFNNDDMLAATVLAAIYRQEVESISQALGGTGEESHQDLSNPVSRKWKLLSSNKSHYFKTNGNNKGPIMFKQYSGTSTSVLSATRLNNYD